MEGESYGSCMGVEWVCIEIAWESYGSLYGSCMGVETARKNRQLRPDHSDAPHIGPQPVATHWAPASSLESQPQEALLVSCGVTKTESGDVTYIVGCRERRHHLRVGCGVTKTALQQAERPTRKDAASEAQEERRSG